VRVLAPLAGLSNLQSLDGSACRLDATLPAFWQNLRKVRLVLYKTIIPHVPAAVLSRYPRDDCFDSLRVHFKKDIALEARE
jgi:hypothetical protein